MSNAGRRGDLATRIRRSKPIWQSAAVLLLLAGPPSIDRAWAEATVLHEFVDGRDFYGRVQLATSDGQGNAWIATYRQLYKVEHGTPVVVSSGGKNPFTRRGARRWALCVAGQPKGPVRTAVELQDLLNRPGTGTAELEAREHPYGFGTLYLGRKGNHVVGVTALEDPEGLQGLFRYTFWSGEGHLLETMTLEGKRIGIFDENSTSILLLGDADAAAFRTDGTPLWTVAGRFRKAALGSAGSIALLNPADRIKEVHLVRSASSNRS